MFKSKGYKIQNFSFALLITISLISAIGLIVMQSLKSTHGTSMFIKQLLGVAAGLVIALIVAFIDYKFICKFCIPLYFFNIFLMMVCRYVNQSTFRYLYGTSVDEARRWLRIGGPSGLDIMPSEITKIVLVLCLAKLFVFFEDKLNKLSSLLIIFAVAGFPILLVFVQPDLSTTIVIATSFIIMLFIAGLSYKLIIPVLAVGIPSFVAFLWYIQQDYGSLILKPWQRNRILSILHPEDYPDLMYQQNNAAAAIKAGKFFGKMLTDNDAERLTDYVPVSESDFIFSGICEELGFLGSLVVILLFLTFLFLSLKIAINAKDKLGRYVASGIAIMITVQALVNIGVVISLLPNTGIPLPFVSYGLSSLLTNFLDVGIILNVGLQNKNVNPVYDDVIQFGKYHKTEI